MKWISFLTFLLLVSCASNQEKFENWEFRDGCSTPESVYFDSVNEHIFVSNIAGEGTAKNSKGYISKLSKDGILIDSRWVSGLNAPKGMRSFKGKLWVSDIDFVHRVDIQKGVVEKSYQVKGAKFLNDIAIDSKGIVYVSDTLTSKIHKIQDDMVTTFMKGKNLESPNGLLVVGSRLYVAAWGLTKDWSTKVLGRLYSIDLKTKRMSFITKTPLGNLDGLEINKNGDFLVSDWVTGKVYTITKEGKVSLIFKGKKGLADIGYHPMTEAILIPYMLNNKVFNFLN